MNSQIQVTENNYQKQIQTIKKIPILEDYTELRRLAVKGLTTRSRFFRKQPKSCYYCLYIAKHIEEEKKEVGDSFSGRTHHISLYDIVTLKWKKEIKSKVMRLIYMETEKPNNETLSDLEELIKVFNYKLNFEEDNTTSFIERIYYV